MTSIPQLPARFPDPPDSPRAVKTISRWDGFLGSVAAGMTIPDAMLKHYVKKADIETMCRASKEELKKFQQAKLAGLRSAYSEFDLDEFFNRVAMGTLVADAFKEVFGTPPSPTFYKVLREDSELEERYQDALKTKAMLEMEKAINIIDDDSNDTLPGPKGGAIPNMAAVQRSRLKFEGRSKLAGNWYRRLYGEQKEKAEVTVNFNLVERMERGIANARAGKVVAAKLEDPIDAQFTPVVVEKQDASWMEDKPKDMDTTWLEEK